MWLLTQTVKIVGRGLLSANLAYLVAIFVAGFREATLRLSRAYDELNPFNPRSGNRQFPPDKLKTDDISALIKRYLSGNELEIGAGNNPYCDPARTTILDKYPTRREGCVSPNIVADASCIPVPNNTFDYVLSSHTLEHMPNTLKTLEEWKRVLKSDGVLFLVLPHKERTYDSSRPITPFSHHLEDLELDVGYEDERHLAEWESTVLLTKQPHPWAEYPEALNRDKSLNWNWMVNNGKVHYHVWTQNELIVLLGYLSFSILVALDKLEARPDSFIVIARAIKHSKIGGRLPSTVGEMGSISRSRITYFVE